MTNAEYREVFGRERPSALGKIAQQAQSDPRVAVAMDLIGLGLAGAGVSNALRMTRPTLAPRAAVAAEPPVTFTPAAGTSLDVPTFMRRTGLTAADLQHLSEQKLRDLYDAEVQHMHENWKRGLDQAGDPLPPVHEAPQKPLNIEALQKMLGDVFQPMLGEPKGAYGGTTINNKGIVDAFAKSAMQYDQLRAAGHEIPPAATVEDLQNLAVWGKTKGPWRHPTPSEKAPPAGGLSQSRADVLNDMQEFGTLARERAQMASDVAANVNVSMRDAIMAEQGNWTNSPVDQVLPQKLLRQNAGYTLNGVPAMAKPKKRKGY